MSNNQGPRGKGATQTRKIKDLKCLMKVKRINNLDVENPKIFSKIWTVMRYGVSGQQIQFMIREANHVFWMFPPLAFFNNDNVSKLK